MKKCLRCGQENDDFNKTCPNCQYQFLTKKEEEAIKKEYRNPSDLKDNPILSFILAILGFLIPIFVLSIIAIILSRKPAEKNLKPFSIVGLVLGITGIFVNLGILIAFIIVKVKLG